MTYIEQSIPHQSFWKQVPTSYRHNIWILAIGDNAPITKQQMLKDLRSHQKSHKNDI